MNGLADHRKYFNDTREPFALTLGGEKIYFLTSPSDVTTAYKKTESLVFDKIVYEFSRTFGVSKDTMDKVSQNPGDEKTDVLSQSLRIENRQMKSLAQLNNDFWKQQLLPGENYGKLQSRFLKLMDESLGPESTCRGPYVISTGPDGTFQVSLLSWTQDVLLSAAMRAFFGEKLLDVDLDLPQHFLDFDYDNWKLWYKWPDSKNMHLALRKVTVALEKWLAIPSAERAGASFIVETFEKSQKALGTSNEDLAKIFSMVLFV